MLFQLNMSVASQCMPCMFWRIVLNQWFFRICDLLCLAWCTRLDRFVDVTIDAAPEGNPLCDACISLHLDGHSEHVPGWLHGGIWLPFSLSDALGT